jgi:hypothetical protein
MGIENPHWPDNEAAFLFYNDANTRSKFEWSLRILLTSFEQRECIELILTNISIYMIEPSLKSYSGIHDNNHSEKHANQNH